MNRLEELVIGAVLVIMCAAAAILGLRYWGHEQYDAGHAVAIAERAQADAAAVMKRTSENAVVAAHQDEINATITKEKDDEISDLRRRLAAAPRLRVGPSICPDRPAAPTQAQSPASGDSTDPSPGLVSSRADADFKQLIEAVEQDLATGRACQAFIEKNGFVP